MLQPAELSVKVSVRKRRNLLITANSPWTTYLNESPSEKEGKLGSARRWRLARSRLDESPYEKEGKLAGELVDDEGLEASMKAPLLRREIAGINN